MMISGVVAASISMAQTVTRSPSQCGLAVLLLMLWSSCGWAGSEQESRGGESALLLEFRDACIRLPLPGQTTAVVYMTVFNAGRQGVAIKAVEVSGASRAELHQHLHEDGMMRMRKVNEIDLPARQSIAFQPGGYHIMAFNLQPAAEGYRVTLGLGEGQLVSTKVRDECGSHG